MSSLINQGAVLDTGVINETADAFEGAMLFSKVTFPNAYLIPDEPPAPGEWLYADGAFHDVAAARTAAQAIEAEVAQRKAEADAAAARAAFKVRRAAAVEAIVVTTTSGKAFDGNEVSQSRMSRALQLMQLAGVNETLWVLADNTPTQATSAELQEALLLAGQEQARLWVEA